MKKAFSARILNRHDVAYFHCSDCGFLRTESPYWLDEAYADAIAVTDTGLMGRNTSIAAKLACVAYFCLDPRGAYLDVAGGYGILTRLMRDNGLDYYWDDKYCDNLVARGFEREHGCQPFTAMSGFEVVEHVEDPRQFIDALMHQHACRTFIFSTVTYPGPTPPAADWWYYSLITGQHISFFEPRTLQVLAKRLGLQLHAAGGLYLLTDRPIRNAFLLRLLSSPLAAPIARWVRWQLGSRSMPDHLAMTEKLRQGDV